MKKSLARAAVFLAVAALLTGCVRFQSTNTFAANDTVTQEIIIALTPDAASQAGVDLDTLTAATLTAPDAPGLGIDPAKVTIEDYSEEDRRGVRIVATDLTLDEVNMAAGAGLGEIVPGLSAPITVERDGDVYVVTIDAGQGQGLPEIPGGNTIGLIAGSIDFAITFTFPGPVKSASAGRAEGKTVVLGIEDLIAGEEIVIRGQATDAIAWGPILKWGGIGAVAILIIGGAALLVWQDKRRTSQNTLPPPVETALGDDATTDGDTDRTS